MQKKLTVGELRAAIDGVPDELEVQFSSDTEEAYEIIIESAERVTYTSEHFGLIDYFSIYGNANEEEDEY